MSYEDRQVSRARIHINDIKYDLLKIAEPWDGVMFEGIEQRPMHLFRSYLKDLVDARLINSFDLPGHEVKDTSITYDVVIQITRDRTPKRIKIHVGLYKSAWPFNKEVTA
jgi:hypothetical protein